MDAPRSHFQLTQCPLTSTERDFLFSKPASLFSSAFPSSNVWPRKEGRLERGESTQTHRRKASSKYLREKSLRAGN